MASAAGGDTVDPKKALSQLENNIDTSKKLIDQYKLEIEKEGIKPIEITRLNNRIQAETIKITNMMSMVDNIKKSLDASPGSAHRDTAAGAVKSPPIAMAVVPSSPTQVTSVVHEAQPPQSRFTTLTSCFRGLCGKGPVSSTEGGKRRKTTTRKPTGRRTDKKQNKNNKSRKQ